MMSVRGATRLGQLGVAELVEQAEDVAVDRLGPDRVAVVEVAADAGGVDPRVERRGVERDRASFAIAEDADPGLLIRAGLLREPVDQGQHLLHLVADDVPAQLERRPVDELAVGQPGAAVAGGNGAVDQGRDDHPAAALGQPSRHLRLSRHPGNQADELLGRLVGVGNDHHVGNTQAIVGLQQQTLAGHVAECRPANGEDVMRLLTDLHQERSNSKPFWS